MKPTPKKTVGGMLKDLPHLQQFVRHRIDYAYYETGAGTREQLFRELMSTITTAAQEAKERNFLYEAAVMDELLKAVPRIEQAMRAEGLLE